MEYVLQQGPFMKAQTAGYIVFFAAALVLLGCGQKEKPKDSVSPTTAQGDTKATPQAVATTSSTDPTAQGTSGRHRDEGDWVPAEYKSGKGRWKDAAAYVDGVPVGVFWFGELPSTLKPVWIEQIEGLDFLPGDPPPYERVIKVRRYRYSDYFEAIGVDLKTIKEFHLYGPNNQILALTGKEFLEVKDHFYFRFGLGTEGKPIAVVPKDRGKNFDRLMGVAVYIKKKPPTVGANEDDEAILLLDGKRVEGIPYYGEPLRGGIRIYKDDRLVSILKRNKLDPDSGTQGADGVTRWKLFDVLKDQGVEAKNIVQAEVIYDEQRTVRFDRAELESMTFRSTAQGRGQIELNDKTPAHALAFYSKPLPKKVAVSKNSSPDAKTKTQ